MVRCPYCRSHRSRRTRACISCRTEALPSCRPERCMILSSCVVLRTARTGWTLCRRCFRDRLAAILRAQANSSCPFGRCCTECCDWQQFYLVADIISHYCGGPWTVNLSWFYWQTYLEYRQLNSWQSNQGGGTHRKRKSTLGDRRRGSDDRDGLLRGLR